MTDGPKTFGERARARLNQVLGAINDFESQGGVAGAARRGAERVRVEQERLRQDALQHGPLSYYARVRQAYARIEVPFGSDFKTVRTAYRRLMRQYHPDRHVQDPRREQLATEISQKLTSSYDLLVKYLER